MTCPFCTLPPESIVLEREGVVAIRDMYPAGPGHSLVLTRRHVVTYFDATDDERCAIWAMVDAMKLRLDDELSPDGYNVGFNAGVAAGQTVMHLHVHLIPRFVGDTADPRGGVRGAVPGKRRY